MNDNTKSISSTTSQEPDFFNLSDISSIIDEIIEEDIHSQLYMSFQTNAADCAETQRAGQYISSHDPVRDARTMDIVWTD